MYCFIVLLVIALSVSADDNVDREKCVSVLTSQIHCCKKSLHNKTSIIESDIRECRLMPNIPGSCDKSLCFGTKLGFANDDGKINMDDLQKYLEGKLSDHKDILSAMKTECLGDKYKLFGEPDDCDLNKMKKCAIWQYMFRCPDFSNEVSCKGIKDIAVKCLELDP